MDDESGESEKDDVTGVGRGDELDIKKQRLG